MELLELIAPELGRVVRVREEGLILLPELFRIVVPLPDDMPVPRVALPEEDRIVDRLVLPVPLPEVIAVPLVELPVAPRPEVIAVLLLERVVPRPDEIAVERDVFLPPE